MTFAANPPAINTMLFYHATTMIHGNVSGLASDKTIDCSDTHRTNRRGANISNTSSCLNLSPLYERNPSTGRDIQGEQLKSNTFAEEHLLADLPKYA